MIDFNTAIELIRRNGGFKPNRRDTSYYRTYTMEDSRPMQARVSNHGTWLWTWYDKDYDPSYAINTCVVYSENGEDKSDVSVDMEIKDEEGNVVGERKSFEVTQYVYNCQILDDNDAALINQAVQNIWQNKGFKDPLANTHKHAKVMILRPNETPEIITETKYTNMNKKLIRLTESDLHRIVKESVNRVLNEIGDTPRGQYMLGRLQGRQLKNGDSKSAARTAMYSGSEQDKFYPNDMDNYEDLSYSNLLGFEDEKNGEPYENNKFINQNYPRKFRATHLNGISKF